MTGRTVAAVDLGAESGRVTAVSFDGRAFSLALANRFGNTPVRRAGLLRWDIPALWGGISEGLGILAAQGRPVAAIGVDTWGVDYGLLDASGDLLDDPVSYRDTRNQAELERATALLGQGAVYRATGVQIMSINTVFALMADARIGRLDAADTLLMLPDVFHHLLSGSRVSEYTSVSTSGCFDMSSATWATGLLADLGVPTHMLPQVVPPGTDVGPLVGDLAHGALAGSRIVLPAAHDTASAVVGVPFAEPGGLFISSGTWSLAGVEVPAPVITESSQAANLTNEGGYGDTIRLLRNVMGLWILQECRRQWAAEGTPYTYPELTEMASAATGLVSLINPDDEEFLAPGDMPARVREHCRRAGYPVPQDVPALARCVLDSLALSYRAVVDDITVVTGRRPTSVNVVGGGSSNALLAQLTANATCLPVYCGPVEATALGNAGVQLAALGELSGLSEIRQAIRNSSEIVCYEPRSSREWEGVLPRFRSLRDEAALSSPKKGPATTGP